VLEHMSVCRRHKDRHTERQVMRCNKLVRLVLKLITPHSYGLLGFDSTHTHTP
jgi:hypothetical protein